MDFTATLGLGYQHQIYSRFHKKRNNLRMHNRGTGDFVTAFWANNNNPIYMCYCSFLVQGGPLDLDTGSCPTVVNDRYWFSNCCDFYETYCRSYLSKRSMGYSGYIFGLQLVGLTKMKSGIVQ